RILPGNVEWYAGNSDYHHRRGSCFADLQCVFDFFTRENDAVRTTVLHRSHKETASKVHVAGGYGCKRDWNPAWNPVRTRRNRSVSALYRRISGSVYPWNPGRQDYFADISGSASYVCVDCIFNYLYFCLDSVCQN